MVDRSDLPDEATDVNDELSADTVKMVSDGLSSAVSGGTDSSAAADAETVSEESAGDAVSDASADTVSDGASGKRSAFGNFWRVVKRVFLFILSMLNPKNLFSGKMISIDFILHRWKTLLVVFLLLMFYISNRYSCQQKVTHIGVLRKEVEELGYRSLDMFVRLKRIQREEAVIKAVRDSALDLQYPDIPPYIILDKDYGSE
ncbi:MAG: hypothetical protein IAC54_00650 [Bacteroidetes bacterium]|uniref:Uncharacterized protein n=1 Tax=Candidatus Caccoplasma merdipullorum TaxID=2840718 RepID=A0A9D9E3R9_9BACT|nr:hypothetical protein [Candidatus Caccoplasma merdipullorum]